MISTPVDVTFPGSWKQAIDSNLPNQHPLSSESNWMGFSDSLGLMEQDGTFALARHSSSKPLQERLP